MAKQGWKSVAAYWVGLAVVGVAVVCVVLFLHPGVGAAGGCGGG
jgi:hypothetical protein